MVHILNLGPQCGTIGGPGSYKREDLMRGFSWHAFNQDYGMVVSSTLSFVSGHEMNGLHSSHNMKLVQKQWNQQPEIFKIVCQNHSFFFLSWLSQVFCCSDRKQTHTLRPPSDEFDREK
jgi:hypothetical protein